MGHWLKTIAVVAALGIMLPMFSARALTCLYNSTQSSCACSVAGSGVQCYGGQLLRQSDLACIDDPSVVNRPAQINGHDISHYVLNCPANVDWSCDTNAWPCNCEQEQSKNNTDCTTNTGGYTPNANCARASNASLAVSNNAAFWSRLISNGYYTNRCQGIGCLTGYDLCAAPGTGFCVQTKTDCPAGTTWDVCTAACTTPYLLLNPPAGVGQTGDVTMTGGNFYITGKVGIGAVSKPPQSVLQVKGTDNWGTDLSIDAEQNAGHRWVIISTAA